MPAQQEGEEGQDGELGDEDLGGGHADLRPGMVVDAGRGFPGDELPTTFTMPRSGPPFCRASRIAARVSAVSPTG